jgi:glycosyltransferase involved in cell wall biosynthesis
MKSATLTRPAIRLACWPRQAAHPYLRGLYDALRPHGIELSVDGLPFTDRFLREERGRFDGIHLHWPEHLWGAGSAGRRSRLRGVIGMWRFLRLAQRLRVPIIWTVHDLAPHERGDWVDEVGYRILGRYAAITVCHDTHTRSRIRAGLRANAADVFVMAMGVESAAWPAPRDREGVRTELGVTGQERLLLCFGSIRPYKGLEGPIDAMRMLAPGHRLVIVGEALDPDYLEALRRRARSTERILVDGRRLGEQEASDVIHTSDCAIFAYRTITGSAALFCPLGAGVGVVTSDLPFFAETLAVEPLAGVRFRPGDPRDLARAVGDFFAVPPRDRGRAARRVADRHEWPVVVRPFAERLWQRLGASALPRHVHGP